MKPYIQIAFVIFLVLGIVACSPATAATQTATSLPQPAPAEGFHPLTTRTGNPEIDKILEAVASGDDQQLLSLIQFTNTTCTQADGLGGPPKCRAGEDEGTPVEVLPFMGSEGSFLRKDEIGNWQGVDAAGLYAVYEVSSAVIFEQYFPAGKYAIVLAGKEDQSQSPPVLRVDGGRIVRVDYLVDNSPEVLKDLLEREAGTVILPPLD